MMAHLVMMANRLVELHRVLKPTGSLYLHCDPTASHYLKIVLDGIFGKENYVNEIIWQKIRTTKAQTIGFGKVHDIIFSYSKEDEPIFNQQRKPFDPAYIKSHYKPDPITKRLYRLVSLVQKGKGPARKFNDKLIEPPTGMHWIWSQNHIDDALAKGRIIFTSKATPCKLQYLDEMEGDIVDDLWTEIYPINSQANDL
jgi:adenine specific DNA methylase Mod